MFNQLSIDVKHCSVIKQNNVTAPLLSTENNLQTAAFKTIGINQIIWLEYSTDGVT